MLKKRGRDDEMVSPFFPVLFLACKYDDVQHNDLNLCILA